MTRTPDRALFVMPRDGSQWRNAVGLWVTVAGWAAAGARRFGSSWIVTPGETVDADGALAFTTPTRGGAPARASRVPLVVKTAVKDGRQAVRAERFRRAALPTEAREGTTAFVWQHHDVFARAGSAIAKELGVPLVSYVHAPQVWEAASWGVERPGWGALVERYGERPALLESDVVACVSTAVAQELGRFGVDPARMRTILLGVDDVFVPPTIPRVPGRILAMASADAPMKGIATLLEAFAKLAVERDVSLVLVTRPEPGGRTEQLIDQLGIADKVTFVNGVSDAELVEVMGSAEVACVPSLYEGFSLPTAELMACATPLVVSRAGAIPEVVGPDGTCADLVAPGDVGELEQAVAALLDDPERRTAMGAAGRARVEELFSWRAVAEATAAAYEETIAAFHSEQGARRQEES